MSYFSMYTCLLCYSYQNRKYNVKEIKANIINVFSAQETHQIMICYSFKVHCKYVSILIVEE